MSYIGRMPLVRSRIVFGTTSHGGPRPATTACHSAISFLGNPRPVHTTLICPPACLPARPPYRRHLYLFSAPARLHAPLPSRHSVGRLSSEGLVQLHAASSRRQSVCCPGRAYVALCRRTIPRFVRVHTSVRTHVSEPNVCAPALVRERRRRACACARWCRSMAVVHDAGIDCHSRRDLSCELEGSALSNARSSVSSAHRSLASDCASCRTFCPNWAAHGRVARIRTRVATVLGSAGRGARQRHLLPLELVRFILRPLLLCDAAHAQAHGQGQHCTSYAPRLESSDDSLWRPPGARRWRHLKFCILEENAPMRFSFSLNLSSVA